MALTDQEFALLQKSIDAIMERIATLQLSLVVDNDFQGLVRFLQERNTFIYPSFDPARSTMSGECFWFRLKDIHGATVASHADRLFVTDDFCDLIESGELWFDDPAPKLGGNIVSATRPPVPIAGKVGRVGARGGGGEHGPAPQQPVGGVSTVRCEEFGAQGIEAVLEFADGVG